MKPALQATVWIRAKAEFGAYPNSRSLSRSSAMGFQRPPAVHFSSFTVYSIGITESGVPIEKCYAFNVCRPPAVEGLKPLSN